MLSIISKLLLHNSNGNIWEQFRNNDELIIFPSAVRNTSTTSEDFINHNARGVSIFINITAVPGVDTITPRLEWKDPASGVYINVATGTARAAAGLFILTSYPGTGGTGGQDFSRQLVRTWRLVMVHSAATNFTYSVGASYTL